MSLNLEQKQAVVAEVAKEVAGAQAIVLVENRGLPVAAMTQLRAKARTSGVYFRVIKNTLVRRAVVETPFAPLADSMVGPLAYGIGSDPVAVAKVLNDFAKTPRQVRHHRRRHARSGDVRQGHRRAGCAAVARGADREAARHHAGAGDDSSSAP